MRRNFVAELRCNERFDLPVLSMRADELAGYERGGGETVDAGDLKSPPGNRVRVRIPPPACSLGMFKQIFRALLG